MSYDPLNTSSRTGGFVGSGIDAGLQSFMQSVYRTMGLGLLITALASYGVAATPGLFALLFGTPLKWVVVFAPLVMVMFGFTRSRVASMQPDKLKMMFVIFSALIGVSLATLFQVYSGQSLARAFFITSATFAATSLYGYTTRRDLTGVGSFLFMGLIGIVIASVVNMFLQSAMVQFVASVIGVVVFTGLTAWETQNLKSMYRDGATEANSKLAIVGALNLYLNFINLFQIIIGLTGDRR